MVDPFFKFVVVGCKALGRRLRKLQSVNGFIPGEVESLSFHTITLCRVEDLGSFPAAAQNEVEEITIGTDALESAVPRPTTKAAFIEPMLLLPTSKLPEGTAWMYELKLDGYREIAFKSDGRVQLRSRNNKDFTRKYPAVAAALAGLPDETVVEGEVVALDESGRPSFNALQNYASWPNLWRSGGIYCGVSFCQN